MNIDRNKLKFALLVFGIGFASLLLYSIITLVSQAGKTKVSIEVLPKDSVVTINDSEGSSGDTYLEPGEYTFSATKDGFEKDTQTIIVDEGELVVVLLPEPVSEEALEWSQQPDVALQLESYGGLRATQRGMAIRNTNPLIDRLPHVDFAGPFVVDYGYYGADSTKTYIVIRDTTPNGRIAAIEWIRDQGVNPAELDIRFSDYRDPLSGENTVEDY